MGNVFLIQKSFATGEISESMVARDDVPKLSMGVMTMRNRTVLPHGPTRCRTGYRHAYPAKYGDKLAVLRPFVYSTDQQCGLEFGDYYIRFYKNHGIIIKTVDDTDAWASGATYAAYDYVKNDGLIYRCLSAHAAAAGNEPGTGASWTTCWVQDDVYEIASPYSSEQVRGLKLTQSADVVYIMHVDHWPRMLTRYGYTDWQLDKFMFENGPFLKENSGSATLALSATKGSGVTLTASEDMFETGHVGSLWKIRHKVATTKASGSFTGTGTSSVIKGMGKWKLITNGTWAAKIDLEISADGTTWETFRAYSGSNNNNVGEAELSDGLGYYRLNCYSYTSGTLSYDLSMQSHKWDCIVRIVSVTDAKHAVVDFIEGEEAASTAATEYWAEGAWSDVRGWPTCAVFSSENRFCLGGSAYEPLMVRESVNDDYTNFRKSNPIVDDDAVSVPMVAREVNAVRALVSMADLIALTSEAEFRISSANGGATTPSNVRATPQEFNGISHIAPVTVGNRILFNQAQGSIILDMAYQFDSDAYRGSDVTIFARHLFEGHTIVDMWFQKAPQSILWCVRDDGILLGLTYLRDQEVWAWHWHDTDGSYESGCSVQENGVNENWAMIKRTIDGIEKRYVEYQLPVDPMETEMDFCYLDSSLVYEGEPIATVPGLAHLEGKTVVALADGFIVRDLVVAGGVIELPEAAAKIIVGLPYVMDLELPDAQMDLQDGTSQGRLKQVVNLILRLENSVGGKVGPTFNGPWENIPCDNPANYNEPLSRFTGEVSIPFPGDPDTRGRVCIRQEDPLPLTILAAIREVTFLG